MSVRFDIELPVSCVMIRERKALLAMACDKQSTCASKSLHQKQDYIQAPL